MEKITICLIDDHQIVRHGLKELLHKMNNYKVVCEFESGAEFLAALPMDNPPDLFILDYSMPGMDGIEVLKALEARPEEYKVLLLTQHIDQRVIDAACHSGIRGFLHKNCTAPELRSTIDNIAKIGYDNITEILRRVRTYPPSPSKLPEITLSAREQEFLTLVCHQNEYTYDQMADIIGVSVKSIEAYRAALFERFDIKSKVGLVLFSYKNRLTPPFV